MSSPMRGAVSFICFYRMSRALRRGRCTKDRRISVMSALGQKRTGMTLEAPTCKRAVTYALGRGASEVRTQLYAFWA
jgi:hypothetical protein